MTPSSVLHLTTLHPRFDVRIYIKEVKTLAAHLGRHVILVVADGLGDSEGQESKLSIRDLGRLGIGRLRRAVVGTWRAFFAVRKIKPDLIHFHDPELLPLAVFFKFMGYRVIYDVHEDLPKSIVDKEWIPLWQRNVVAAIARMAEWFGSKIFDEIVAATPTIGKRFSNHKTIVVQNFPLLDDLNADLDTAYSERGPVFVYAGNISKLRGVNEMVCAMESLPSHLNARLVLLGDFGDEGLSLDIKTRRGWTFVDYIGWKSRKEVAVFFNSARAGMVVFRPRPNHVEALPNKLFEYMAAGIPVIASDFPLWRRIVENAKCGLLVDPMDPKAVAEAMLWILEHPLEAEEMGRCGRLAVEKTYNWDIEAVKLVKLYNQLLAS